MIKKVVFSVAWIGIFILSIIGILYKAVPQTIGYITKLLGPLTTELIIPFLAMLYFIVSIIKFLSMFETVEDYEIKTENGTVLISSTSVTSFIYELLSPDEQISNLTVKSIKKDKQFNIYIKLDLNSIENIAEKFASIQNEIRAQLADKMGLEIGDIDVKICKLSTTLSENVKPSEE